MNNNSKIEDPRMIEFINDLQQLLQKHNARIETNQDPYSDIAKIDIYIEDGSIADPEYYYANHEFASISGDIVRE